MHVRVLETGMAYFIYIDRYIYPCHLLLKFKYEPVDLLRLHLGFKVVYG